MNSREIAAQPHKNGIKFRDRVIEWTASAVSVTSSLFDERAADAHVRRRGMASLRPILTGSSGHEIVEHDSIGGTAQFFEKVGPAKSSGHASQRAQLRALIFL